MNGRLVFGFVIFYLVINFVLMFLMRHNIRPLAYFHILVIFVLFIWAIVRYVRNRRRLEEGSEKIKDGGARVAYLASAFTRSAGHLFFCYVGFFYLYCFLYFCYLWYNGKLGKNEIFYLKVIILTGFILAVKETFLQFTQCFNAAMFSSSYSIPYCDDHYYKYWNCINNETVRVDGEE